MMFMSFTLPKLNHSLDALEPHIDKETMEIHHGKHHQGYINKLNETIEANSELQGKSLEELLTNLDSLPAKASKAIRNTAGGHFNHSLFWEILSPNGGGEPKGKLAEEITKTFGTFQNFKEEFNLKASSLFGSGWTWLVKDKGKLVITTTPNQDSPVSNGQVPLLALDLWEHAYYLKYQNRRPDYIYAFWQIVDWDKIEKRYSKLKN
jgi:superoxide dismutase, Fe-Mn family